MQGRRWGRVTLGFMGGLGALVAAAAAVAGLAGPTPAPPAAVAAPAARDGVSAAVLARPALDAPAPANDPPVAIVVVPAASGEAAAAPQPAAAPEPSPAQDLVFDDYYVHVPPGVKDPAPVLVALHGMGADGRSMCDSVRAWSDREGWVLVGPTFSYGDWTDPSVVAAEGPRTLPRIAKILDDLPATIGHPVQSKVVLYGFSRGAQTAERFAMMYPDRVRGAVLMSAGTYTLPLRETSVDGRAQRLNYPFGIADVQRRYGRDVDVGALRNVPFWIGVGSEDNDPNAVPTQWSPYLGNTRVERAQRLAATLRDLQVSVQETEFPGLGHDISPAEHDQALAWVRTLP